MSYQIDQSGKIEFTSKSTVLALSNGKSRTIKISAAEKQKLLRAVKEIEKPKQNYIYKLFATLIFLLIKGQTLKVVEIDKEYPGHESVIKDTLIYLFAKNRMKLPEISFVLVGKKSNSHIKALLVYQEKQEKDFIVKAEGVLEVLYGKRGNKKGWRSSSGNDNP